MAVLLSKATGNLTAATVTWGLVDATSYLNAENATESLLTTAYSGTRSTAFTPGAITVEGVAVKLCERIGTTGTMSVSLRNATLGLDDFVTGTEVTINTSDLPSALEADLNGGWIYFKFASPVALLAATNYNVQAKTSSATMVDLWCDGTVDNVSRALVTSTEQAPAAGDDLIITKSWTAAATGTDVVVTMNSTAATDYGAASTSLVTPAIAICQGGTLRFGNTAATAYLLKVSGNVIVYSGGVIDHVAAMPRDSSVDIQFDCGANVDFGLTVRNLGTWNPQGLSRTVGKLIDRCLLNTDEAVNSTSLGVDTDTGWLDNDVIVVASTSRTPGDSEQGALNGAAGASTLTVDGFAGAGGGLAAAHSGTSPTQAEVILLTRNVTWRGTSATLQSYVDIKATATIDADWTEFKWLGSATANKRGIDVAGTQGGQSFNYCSLHNFVVASSRGFSCSAATGTGIDINNHVSYNIQSEHFTNTATTGTWSITNAIGIRSTTSGTGIFSFNDLGGTATNITGVGHTNSGFGINCLENSTSNAILSFSDFKAHSNSTSGVALGGSMGFGLINGLKSWRNTAGGITVNGGQFTVDNAELFGNQPNVSLGAGQLILNSPTLNGDTTFSTTSGVSGAGSFPTGILFVNGGNFGTVSGIKTAHTNDIIVAASCGIFKFTLNNTILASATEVSGQTSLGILDSIDCQRHDGTSGNHKSFKRYGLITVDTVIFDASPSVRMAPNNATGELKQIIGRVNVNSGQTVTPSVKLRESVVGDGTDYNGNRAKLYVSRNDALGITADTLLDTATGSSEGAWETLTGATAAASEDGVMEFYITCDGTTGWVNVDTLTVVTGGASAESGSFGYWHKGQPYGTQQPASAGGGGLIDGRLIA